MNNLKEIHLTDTNIRLDNNIVKGGILPNKMSELSRTVNVVGETVVEGPLYADKLTIEAAPLEVNGAVFTLHELYINNDVSGTVTFRKAVGSASSVVSRAMKCMTTFCSDVNAKRIALSNAFVAGSLYGDEITLENCVVIGGVFATQTLFVKDCIVGTFISPLVELDGKPFKYFEAHRDTWAVETCYTYPGAIQYYGPDEVCNLTTRTLALEKGTMI